MYCSNNLETLFENFQSNCDNFLNNRIKPCDKKDKTNDSIDKNSKILLNSVLIKNTLYGKKDIPQNFSYNHETGEVSNIDILPKITPFTTDKLDIFSSLSDDIDNLHTLPWSRQPKSLKYKAICRFINELENWTPEEKNKAILLFKTKFEVSLQYIEYCHKTKSILNLEKQVLDQ